MENLDPVLSALVLRYAELLIAGLIGVVIFFLNRLISRMDKTMLFMSELHTRVALLENDQEECKILHRDHQHRLKHAEISLATK